MRQEEALKILKTGANVFLTGEPGAGKTHTINNYISYLRDSGIEPAITASTGIAATHIGGMTIHSWSGIGIRNFLNKYDLDKIATSEYLHRRILKTKVLIIDEISMLPPYALNMIDSVCREIKGKDEAFGGIQVILVGDFFQLPPINKKIIEDKQIELLEKKNENFAYQSYSWKNLNLLTCYIKEQHRQEDKIFLDFLNAIRNNSLKEEHYKSIKSRYIEKSKLPEDITKLYSHNFDVDKINLEKLEKIEGEIREFQMSSVGSEKIINFLKKGCLSPEKLFLKIGAIVMCTKNNPKEHFVNGTLGTVIDFDLYLGNPIIKTKNGRIIKIPPMDWTIEENGKIKAKITQIPLRLAWAITVHKSQGMSLDSAIMDLSAVFEYGQGYVALSRVRRMSGLYLLGVNDKALKVHPEILKQDKIFRENSKEIKKIFEKLSEKEIKTMHENFIRAIAGVNIKKKKKTKKY